MLKVGITGGIGSGKSTVCALFEVLGIPVLYADDLARRLMEHDDEVVRAVAALLGEDSYRDGRLQRSFIAAQVFQNSERLAALNAIVHPAVWRHGAEWFGQQRSAYAIKEAALFFESGSALQIDVMVGVQAPDPLRIRRVMAREGATAAGVEARMARQMPQEEKMQRCDAVIINDDVQAILPQVLQLHERFLAGSPAPAG